MPLLQYGHRGRSPYLDQTEIPALQVGIMAAQQFGKDWYVNSAAAAGGNGASPAGAVTTLVAALALAISGDRIFIAPGHTENIAAAGGITWATSGITVVGLGVAATRPTFTWTVVGATFVISGANNLLSNIRCLTSVDEMVSAFSITGNGNILDRVDVVETPAMQFIQFAAVTGTDCIIQNCAHHQATAAAAAQLWITVTNATRFKLLNNQFFLALQDGATCCVFRGVTSTNILIKGNDVKMTGFAANLLSAFLALNTTTGVTAYNNIGADVAAVTTINDLPGCRHFQTLATLLVDKSGILDPVV